MVVNKAIISNMMIKSGLIRACGVGGGGSGGGAGHCGRGGVLISTTTTFLLLVMIVTVAARTPISMTLEEHISDDPDLSQVRT